MKVVIELEPHDARIVTAMLLVAGQLLRDRGTLVLGPVLFSEDLNSSIASTLGLLSGATLRSEIPDDFEEFEAKVAINLLRIKELLKTILVSTDRELVTERTTWLDSK